MQTYKSQSDIALAVEALAAQDEGMARAYAEYGAPPLRRGKPGFEGLIGLLISQQVSTKAAEAIHARFHRRFPDAAPRDVLAASDEALAAVGLSRPKQRYLRILEQAIDSGQLDTEQLAAAGDDEIFAELTALIGIGAWTADCYLLFNLGRCDRFPAGDLALQEGYRLLYSLNARPDAKQLADLAQRFQPHRAAAARMIWHFYSGERAKVKLLKQ